MLLNDEPPALLGGEIEFRHGRGFGRLVKVGALTEPRYSPLLRMIDAPASPFDGGGLLSLHVLGSAALNG
jgi:hypothetical protein